MILQYRNFIHTEVGGPGWVSGVLVFVSMIALACASYYIAKWILGLVRRAVEKTATKWDDDLLTAKLLRALAQLAPAITVSWLLPQLYLSIERTHSYWINWFTSIYIIIMSVRILVIFTGNLYMAMNKRPATRPYAIKGIFQSIKLVVICMGVIVALSLLIGKTPLAIVTTLGASAAVLMLVFKDTIMGLVASVQLNVGKMLQRGDWIIAKNHEANGEVIDISLTTVKIRNWDNTITTVPPYSLVQDSFVNYQPMRNSGGRRACPTVFIDVNTVRFLTQDELDALISNKLIRKSDLNQEDRQVNLGVYRRYLEHYLLSRSDVNGSLLLMVRQLEPTPSGLPLQLYFFTHTTEWKAHETILSEVFDHIYASARDFGLRIFQTPAGADIEALGNNFESKALTHQKLPQ